MKTLFLFFAFILLVSCNCPKEVKNTNDSNNIEKQILKDTYRFTVSFISIGSGTDKKAIKSFEQYLNDYKTSNSIKLSYQVTKFGKEGEVDYCLKLNELPEIEQTTFISETKELLKSSSLVRYRENTTCNTATK